MRLFAVWFIFVSVFAFDDSECVFFILFTTLENRRRRRCREALFQVPVTPKPGTQRATRQAILMLAVTTYQYLSCMFSLLKFYQKLDYQNYFFDVAITAIKL